MTTLDITTRRAMHATASGALNSRDIGAKRYSNLELEAALAVWEFIVERVGFGNGAQPGTSSWDVDLVEYKEGVGTVELRTQVAPIAAWCLRVYEAMTPDETGGVAYDWEVIPAIVRHVRFGNHKPCLPDILLTAQAVAEELAG